MTASAPRRSTAARKRTAGLATALTAVITLTAGMSGSAHAAPSPEAGGAGAVSPNCGEAGAGRSDGVVTADAARITAAPLGRAVQRISLGMPAQAPIGLWSTGGVTLRTPVSKGTVRLDVRTHGFSVDSLAVQRYVPKTHRWVDLAHRPGSSAFTLPLTAAASAAHPYTVALRLQDVDRPGTLTTSASVADGHGHVHRTPTRTTRATRPAVSVTGWPHGATLVRGGAARAFTVTVKNTTNRSYPALNASYFAYGAGTDHALTPKDLVLQEYRGGRWARVALLPGGCDPGMGAALPGVVKGALAPGATAVYRLRVAVAPSAPADVTNADAGIAVGSGDATFFFQSLPFTIKAHGSPS